MNYLNYYSLLRENYSELAKTLPSKKLFNLANTTYCFLFIVNNKIVTREKNPFFFSVKKVNLNFKFISLTFINKKKNKIFILCNLSEQVFKNNTFFENCYAFDIREVLFKMKNNDISIISAGYSLYKWQNNNQYCGKWGCKT